MSDFQTVEPSSIQDTAEKGTAAEMPVDRRQDSDPCEKCGEPVYGYVEERCCSGEMCGCMGMPVSPCWCDTCWTAYTAQAQINAAVFA